MWSFDFVLTSLISLFSFACPLPGSCSSFRALFVEAGVPDPWTTLCLMVMTQPAEPQSLTLKDPDSAFH